MFCTTTGGELGRGAKLSLLFFDPRGRGQDDHYGGDMTGVR